MPIIEEEDSLNNEQDLSILDPVIQTETNTIAKTQITIGVEFEEPDDPVDGIYHRLIIGAAAVGATFAIYIIFCVIGKKRGWFTKAAAGLKTATEKKGYVYRDRTSEVVRDSRPESNNESNVYQEEQRPSAAVAHSAQKLMPQMDPVVDPVHNPQG